MSVSLQRGGKPLLDSVSAVIHSGQRVGLIGANGAGKSSLFQLLLGQLHADAGEVSLPRQARIAHMAQEVALGERLALDHVLDGDSELRAIERAIEAALADGDDAALAARYADLETIDAHMAGNRAEQLLSGLGFSPEDFQRPAREFSGGWRIRLNLAQALMCPSDILLLDEPTNHLDLDATIWLEQWLKAYRGTLVLISHDRDFIDAIATHIAHIEHQQLRLYAGNYSAFELQRAEQLAQQQAEYKKQQQSIGEMHRFVERFRAKATKARQAQSRLKALARMEVIAPAHVDSPFHFEFPALDIQAHTLLAMHEADLGYGGTAVITGLDLGILRESRIGLLGPNGAGKSTLVKSLVGSIELLQGERVCANNLRIGYFAQHQLEDLDMGASPLTHVQRLSPDASEQSIRNFLGGFNFHGDNATGSIRHFSGGEKARLALALVVWQKPNLVIMDEPTNHLDIEMRHALNVALQAFDGAVILVAHDRHLLRNTVTEFLLVADGSVTPFAGDLEDYERWLVRDKKASQAGDSENARAPDRKSQRREAAAQRARLQPLKKELHQVEQAMDNNSAAIGAIEEQLADETLYAAESKAQLQALLERQGSLKSEAGELEDRWLQLSDELEKMAAAAQAQADTCGG